MKSNFVCFFFQGALNRFTEQTNRHDDVWSQIIDIYKMYSKILLCSCTCSLAVSCKGQWPLTHMHEIIRDKIVSSDFVRRYDLWRCFSAPHSCDVQREREGWNLVGARDDFKSIALESMSYAQMRKTRKSNYISFGDEEHAALNVCRQQVVEVAAMKLNLHTYVCVRRRWIYFFRMFICAETFCLLYLCEYCAFVYCVVSRLWSYVLN